MTLIARGVLVLALVAGGFGPLTHSAHAQDMLEDAIVELARSYQALPDITYFTAGGVDLKLDLYLPRNSSGANKTLVYYHGGGWTGGRKERSVLNLLPYLQMGWTVVNVEYRLAGQALAPAAVEDTRCALRWVYRNAEEYGFDTDRIILAGGSAGGHLALIVGMLTKEAGLDHVCPGNRDYVWYSGSSSSEELKVAAIINWYGITDVEDLIGFSGASGPFADAWLGSSLDRVETARRVSPINYVRADLPPIFTVHGDQDAIVPYSHAVRLHKALDEAGVPNQFITVEGGGHGGFSVDQMKGFYREIRTFLREHGIEE